jgi:hypothetical protein
VTTVVQVPTELGTSHAWHCPVHGELQHTPSTQSTAPPGQFAAFALVHAVPNGRTHVPAYPATLQCSPAPHVALALLQHTPSMQKRPALQSPAVVQTEPGAPVGTHDPPEHLYPAAHCELSVQVVSHRPVVASHA